MPVFHSKFGTLLPMLFVVLFMFTASTKFSDSAVPGPKNGHPGSLSLSHGLNRREFFFKVLRAVPSTHLKVITMGIYLNYTCVVNIYAPNFRD